MSTIVLAHGLFGFGDVLPDFLSFLPSVHYFVGVADHLRDRGHTVLEPQVNPIGSIQQRGEELANKILRQTKPGDRVHIFGYSMGGLDARYAISNRPDLVDRVATLATIGAPHRGSPAADAVVKKTGPLFNNIPDFLKRKLEYNAGALHDLTTEACIPFDEQTADVPNVRYINIAGDASKGGNELLLRPFAEQITNLTGEINDGIVTKSSALRPGNEHMPDWPVDHAGEIGWTKSLFNPVRHEAAMAAHLARYDSIVAVL